MNISSAPHSIKIMNQRVGQRRSTFLGNTHGVIYISLIGVMTGNSYVLFCVLRLKLKKKV